MIAGYYFFCSRSQSRSKSVYDLLAIPSGISIPLPRQVCLFMVEEPVASSESAPSALSRCSGFRGALRDTHRGGLKTKCRGQGVVLTPCCGT